MKKQIIIIHGGNSYNSYEEYLEALKKREVTVESFLPRKGWKNSLLKELENDFQVLTPEMPNAFNAKYIEWKIWFEKMVPFINDGVIMIGHSQGGIFLAKYLSENNYPKKISALILVASPYTDKSGSGAFKLEQSLENVSKQCDNVHLFQSKDDEVVSFEAVRRYEKELPDAKLHIFEDRGHFLQETFPEIIETIKEIK